MSELQSGYARVVSVGPKPEGANAGQDGCTYGCTCVCLKMATHLEPSEWEQDPNCSIHPMKLDRYNTDIERWWAQTAQADYDGFGPKLEEYGSDDLREIGRDLAKAMKWDAPDEVLYELGCWFYLRGKLARAMSAIAAHRLPSDDTALDTTVYSMMIRRIRQEGKLA